MLTTAATVDEIFRCKYGECVKLTAYNYQQWHLQIMPLLNAHGSLDLVAPLPPLPSTTATRSTVVITESPEVQSTAPSQSSTSTTTIRETAQTAESTPAPQTVEDDRLQREAASYIFNSLSMAVQISASPHIRDAKALWSFVTTHYNTSIDVAVAARYRQQFTDLIWDHSTQSLEDFISTLTMMQARLSLSPLALSAFDLNTKLQGELIKYSDWHLYIASLLSIDITKPWPQYELAVRILRDQISIASGTHDTAIYGTAAFARRGQNNNNGDRTQSHQQQQYRGGRGRGRGGRGRGHRQNPYSRDNDRDSRGVQCYACNGYGHYARDCPHASAARAAAAVVDGELKDKPQ